MNFFDRMKKGLLKSTSQEMKKYQKNEFLHSSLQDNLDKIKQTLGNSQDIVIRTINFGKNRILKAGIIYTDGLVDKNSIQQHILEPLMLEIRETDLEHRLSNEANPLNLLQESVLTTGDIVVTKDFYTLFQKLLSGSAILLLDGSAKSLVIRLNKWEDRGVTEPSTQTVIRGPKEGFSETLGTNIALIRRKIKDPRLWVETKSIGQVSQTDVALVYLKGAADEKLIQEMHHRLKQIDIVGVLESGMLEEFLQDETYTPFPTMYNTERPDVIAAGILEGRVALIVDGTPFVLLVPAIFSQFYQSAEDYYQRADIGFLTRFLRYIGMFIALLGPSVFIAITTFHQEMLPYPLLLSIAAQHEGVPFPTFVESLIMLIMFEILREAGVRMPRVVGQAVSIVGAIVIGQAAVEAGFVSAGVVIVISATAIAGFILPSNNMEIAIRIIRIGLMCLAASFGIFGIIMGMIAIILHLCSLHSFGVPYMSPFAPFILTGQKDSIFRFPFAKYRRKEK